MTQQSTPSKIIAQQWFFSCDAPDDDETAKEIQRLAKMIDDVMAGRELKWKVVNRSLRPANTLPQLEHKHIAQVLDQMRNLDVIYGNSTRTWELLFKWLTEQAANLVDKAPEPVDHSEDYRTGDPSLLS